VSAAHGPTAGSPPSSEPCRGGGGGAGARGREDIFRMGRQGSAP
jgi:hypothetical protein